MKYEESSKEANIKAIWRRTAVTNRQRVLWDGTTARVCVKSFWWKLFFRTNMERTERDVGVFTVCTFSQTLTRFCRQRRRKKRPEANRRAQRGRGGGGRQGAGPSPDRGGRQWDTEVIMDPPRGADPRPGHTASGFFLFLFSFKFYQEVLHRQGRPPLCSSSSSPAVTRLEVWQVQVQVQVRTVLETNVTTALKD